jgi:microcystin-dependent protein
MADAHKNFAYTTVATAPSPAISGTSLVVQAATGTVFPTAPFNATVWPAGAQPLNSNAEIVRVTAVSTDTLTIVRSQESSSARTIIAGDQIAAGITVKALTDLEPYINPTGSINAYAGRTAPTNWLICDGAAVSRSTYATLFAAIVPNLGTITMTIAAPAVVSHTAHGFQTGDTLYFTTTGALPTGITANTIYYVVYIDANSYSLATSLANSLVPTKITTTGSQSGTHTAFACPYGLGDGSTTFNTPDLKGRVPAGNNSMGTGGVSRLTLSATGGSAGNLGAAGGEQAHQLTVTELAAHNHNARTSDNGYTVAYNGAVAGAGNGMGRNAGTADVINISNTGGDVAHNNVQPTLVVNYIIKT